MSKNASSPSQVVIDTQYSTEPFLPSPDRDRSELRWEDREEKLLETWCKDVITLSKAHGRAGRFKKKVHTILGALSVMVPVIFTGLCQIHTEPPFSNTIPPVGFVCTGVLSGLLGFLSYEAGKERHFQYEAKYQDFCTRVSAELCKPRKDRVACDVFLKECELQICNLNSSAPDV